jgi:hypothetical protein
MDPGQLLSPSQINFYNIHNSPVNILSFETSEYRLQSFLKYRQAERAAGLTTGLKTTNSDDDFSTETEDYCGEYDDYGKGYECDSSESDCLSSSSSDNGPPPISRKQTLFSNFNVSGDDDDPAPEQPKQATPKPPTPPKPTIPKPKHPKQATRFLPIKKKRIKRFLNLAQGFCRDQR